MLPSRHVFFGSIMAILLLVISKVGIIEASIFLASTVLIDVDHYIYYVFVKKNWSLPKAYRWYKIYKEKWFKLSREERNKHKGVFLFLHGLEVFTVVFLLGIFVHSYFIFIFIGFVFHLFLDIIEMRMHQDRIDKIFLIHDYMKFKKLERQF